MLKCILNCVSCSAFFCYPPVFHLLLTLLLPLSSYYFFWSANFVTVTPFRPISTSSLSSSILSVVTFFYHQAFQVTGTCDKCNALELLWRQKRHSTRAEHLFLACSRVWGYCIVWRPLTRWRYSSGSPKCLLCQTGELIKLPTYCISVFCMPHSSIVLLEYSAVVCKVWVLCERSSLTVCVHIFLTLLVKNEGDEVGD